MEFIERSLPRHSAKGSKRSRANSLVGGDARLSVIAEDGATPAVPGNNPPRNNRTFSRGWAFGNPPSHSFEKPPPQYSFLDVTGPKGEKLTDVRNNRHIARRGGWRRICLIALVVLAVIVALAVGLDSPSRSGAAWNWIISPTSPSQYTISSTHNIFNILFSNATLDLLDQNLQTERYHFSTPFQKVVIPQDALNVRCYYNDTILEGDLYTKLKQVYSDTTGTSTVAASTPTSTAVSFSGGQRLWPYAVEITVSHGGGSDVPDCHRVIDEEPGPRLTEGLQARASTDMCSERGAWALTKVQKHSRPLRPKAVVIELMDIASFCAGETDLTIL
ncbi:MAG: hypothetical protein Q9191_003999 [Dirinaria sp. TL-2023a]